jgi:hypothetical protein
MGPIKNLKEKRKMKRLEEMSRDELINMTDDVRSALADLECAFEGIPLLPPRPEKQDFAYPERDVAIYTVDNYNFTDQAEALAYCEYVNSLRSAVFIDYEYGDGLGSAFKYAKKERDSKTEIRKEMVFGLETYAELKTELKKTKALEDVYKEQMSAYKDARNERSGVYEKIDKAVRDAWNEKRREDMLVGAYEKYIELTGDSDIAIRLLEDAYEITEEEKQTIVGVEMETSA